LQNNAGGAVIITESGEIESDSYSDVALAFAAVAGGGGDGGNFVVPGPYENDAAAATGGVSIGEIYRLTQVNDYDLPSPGGRLIVARTA
jgi:hypothetical protein